jgi:hypothetical protein
MTGEVMLMEKHGCLSWYHDVHFSCLDMLEYDLTDISDCLVSIDFQEVILV